MARIEEYGLRQIPSLADGDVLGRTVYRALFENDSFLNGWADRLVPVPQGGYRNFEDPDTTHTLFDGYIYVDTGHQTLNYWIAAQTNNALSHVNVTLYIDGDNTTGDLVATVEDTDTTRNEASGTFNASGYSGLVRVFCYMERDDSDYNGYGWCAAPWLSYDGSEAYAAPPAIADGDLSGEAQFGTWRDNDAWFREQLSPNHPAGAALNRTFVGGTGEIVIWAGWVQAPNADAIRLHYHVETDFDNDPTTNEVHLYCYFDYLDAAELVVDIDADGVNEYETSADLDGSYTAGNLYMVVWTLSRDAAERAYADIYWTAVCPAAADAAFTVPDEPVAHQYVYGDTAGELTRADLLSDNDAALNDRPTLVYRRFATRKAELQDSISTAGILWRYTFERQQDILMYRGKFVELEWAGGTETLEDYDDAGGEPYQELDLRSVDGLEYGMQYTLLIQDDDGTPDPAAELCWAMERAAE